MTDREELIQRIAEILADHQIRQDYNHPAWGLCHCGFNPDEDDVEYWWDVQAQHQAELVEKELPR